MPRTKLSLSLNGNTFKILYVSYYFHSGNVPISMMTFWRWGGVIKGLGYYAVEKAFKYLRKHELIQRHGWGNYRISDKGIQVLTETLLKRQKLGLTCEIAGICLEVDSNTRQISLKTNLDNSTNPGQVVQITS